MNFLKIKTTWSNAEFIPLKVCIASAYLLIGAFFHHFFREYYTLLFVLFCITGTWSIYLWLHKMKNKNK